MKEFAIFIFFATLLYRHGICWFQIPIADVIDIKWMKIKPILYVKKYKWIKNYILPENVDQKRFLQMPFSFKKLKEKKIEKENYLFSFALGIVLLLLLIFSYDRIFKSIASIYEFVWQQLSVHDRNSIDHPATNLFSFVFSSLKF